MVFLEPPAHLLSDQAVAARACARVRIAVVRHNLTEQRNDEKRKKKKTDLFSQFSLLALPVELVSRISEKNEQPIETTPQIERLLW